jgi:transposase
MSKRQTVKQSKRTRRTFSDAFKVRAVKMVTEQGYKLTEAARNLDIHANLLGRWKEQLSAQEQEVDSTENKELKVLREENKRLRMERDILKKATAFFANEKN